MSKSMIDPYYGKTRFEKDGWYIKAHAEQGHWFWHVCIDRIEYDMPWLVNYYVRDSGIEKLQVGEGWEPSWRCCKCWRSPPDDVLGVYMLLEMDQCADEIKRAEKGQER